MLAKGYDKLRQDLVFHDCFGELFGVVSDSAECEGGAVLDGDGGVDEESPELLEGAEGVEVVDVLGLGCEVGELLGELDLGLLELFEGRLESAHWASYNIIY